jgi:hypothetical protein
VLQEVALPGTEADPEKFLKAAVAFANNRCWGTLSCSLMVRTHRLGTLIFFCSRNKRIFIKT